MAYGVGLGMCFFVVYSAYALAFAYGTTLILDGRADVGIVVNVFMAILVGSFSLAMMAPEMEGAFLAPSFIHHAAPLRLLIDTHSHHQP